MNLSTHTKNALYGYLCGYYDTYILKTSEVWHLMDKDLVTTDSEISSNNSKHRHPVMHYRLTDLGIESAMRYFPQTELMSS
jgi:hypothetical protein